MKPAHVNRLGLTLVHPRTDDATPDLLGTVNIIFVHGLRGHPRSTWEYKTSNQQTAAYTENDGHDDEVNKKRNFPLRIRSALRRATTSRLDTLSPGKSDSPVHDESVFWPADLLPSVVPRAYIWTYGYNADLLGGLFQANNKNSIAQHGNDFMVKMERGLTNELPVIFVAHSLGGLLIKSALHRMNSCLDPRYERLLGRIKAVVFCGTPHRGSNAAAWGRIITKMAAVAFIDTNSRLLSELHETEFLDLIQENFLKVLYQTGIHVHSFQEGRPFLGLKGLHEKIVDDFSSKLGWPQETVETIDAGHREMVRVAGVKDISDVLKELEQVTENKKQAAEIELALNHDKEVLVIFNLLDVLLYRDCKDRNPEPVTGTCQWFTNHPLFETWLEKQRSALLWVSADPGCGKSVLARHLVDKVLPTTDSRITCYFFFKDDFDKQRSSTVALCCILRQIFDQKPVLLSPEIMEKFQASRTQILGSFQDLWKILLSVASSPGSGEILCILDAFDECEESGRVQLSDALNELYKSEIGTACLKFLFTSRPYIRIRRDFQALENRFPTIHLSGDDEIESEKIAQEIKLVIKAKVKALGEELQLLLEEQQTLQRELLQIPHWTYLWVYLVFDVIRNSILITQESLLTIIRTLPMSVEDAYDKILSRSANVQQARRLLHIVVAAERPLRVKEMALALAIKRDSHGYTDLNIEPEHRFRHTLREICGLFVSIRDSKIYLIHQTAREFLFQHEPSATGSPRDHLSWESSLISRESHRILAEICVWHLLFDEFETPSWTDWDLNQQKIKDHLFFDYSAKYWITHCQASDIDRTMTLFQIILHLCDTRFVKARAWYIVHAKRYCFYPDPASCTSLILAAYLGLEIVVKTILEADNGYLNLADGKYGRTALSYAVENGHRGTVQLLLNEGADPDDNPSDMSTLMWTAQSDLPIIAQALLDKGAHLEYKGSLGLTPLFWAVEKRRPRMIEFFLQKGADANSKDQKGETMLSMSARRGDAKVIQLLLDGGADINLRNGRGQSPLLLSVLLNQSAITGMLLDRGAEIDLRDNEDRTPLSWAAEDGNMPITRLLLDIGSDIQSKDSKGRTPLMCASVAGTKSVVDILTLKRGANHVKVTLDEVMEKGGSIMGHRDLRSQEMIKELLKKEGDINARDAYGRTCLSLAAEQGNEAAVISLLSEGSDVKVEDHSGRTPVSYAITAGHKTIMNMIRNRMVSDALEDGTSDLDDLVKL